MEKLNEYQNSGPSSSGLRKIILKPISSVHKQTLVGRRIINTKSVKALQKRKRVEETTLEKTTDEVLTKNQSVINQCTDLRNCKGKLCSENRSPESGVQQDFPQQESISPIQNNFTAERLSMQELATLWKEVSLVTLPWCSCNKKL